MEGGRRNVVYDLVRGVSTTCEDGSFPIDRMPMGLVEYVAKFFAEDSKSKVGWCMTVNMLHLI